MLFEQTKNDDDSQSFCVKNPKEKTNQMDRIAARAQCAQFTNSNKMRVRQILKKYIDLLRTSTAILKYYINFPKPGSVLLLLRKGVGCTFPKFQMARSNFSSD